MNASSDPTSAGQNWGSAPFPERLTTGRRLLIGPANYAGQGYRWANAVTKYLDDASAQSFRFDVDDNPYPVHYRVDWRTYRRDKDWAKRFTAYGVKRYTHVLFEANKTLFGWKKRGSRADIRYLRTAGIRLGMMAHGSDVRIPSVHAEREEWAQYQHMDPEEVEVLEKRAILNNEGFAKFTGPKFASTLGLLDFVEDARWCPVIVEPDVWASRRPVLEARIPVVAHIPSSTQKGSAWIDPILAGLADRGRLEYLRLSGIKREEMPEHVSRCDILIDQFGAADYGVAACEAMAAGRLVISRIADPVRERVLEQTGLELPIVEANPNTLEDVIMEALVDRDASREIAERGTAFIREVHDGRRSAEALAELVDIPAASDFERFARRRRNNYRELRKAIAKKKSKK